MSVRAVSAAERKKFLAETIFNSLSKRALEIRLDAMSVRTQRISPLQVQVTVDWDGTGPKHYYTLQLKEEM